LIILVLLAATSAIAQKPQSLVDKSSEAEGSVVVAEASDVEPIRLPAAPLPRLSPEQAADLQYFHRHYQAAIETYKKIEPRSASVWNKTGIAYQMLYDLHDAIRCYKRALKMDPKNAKVLNNLATVQDSMMDFAAGEKNYRKAIAINPHSATTLRNLGTNLIMQEKYGEGTEAYKQALAIDPHVLGSSAGPTASYDATDDKRGKAAYYKARSCARAGLDDCALANLRQAFDAGFATVDKVDRESDFARLRATQPYVSLIALQK
jgi:tetratricopeptide (TPR) repeat protein